MKEKAEQFVQYHAHFMQMSLISTDFVAIFMRFQSTAGIHDETCVAII